MDRAELARLITSLSVIDFDIHLDDCAADVFGGTHLAFVVPTAERIQSYPDTTELWYVYDAITWLHGCQANDQNPMPLEQRVKANLWLSGRSEERPMASYDHPNNEL